MQIKVQKLIRNIIVVSSSLLTIKAGTSKIVNFVKLLKGGHPCVYAHIIPSSA
jgi:hypothetical protein